MHCFDALYLNVKVFCSKVLTTIRVVNNWPRQGSFQLSFSNNDGDSNENVT